MQGLINRVWVAKRSPSPGPVISVELQITQNGKNDIKLIGYTTRVKLCHIMIGDRFQLISLNLGSGESIDINEEFFINPYLFREIEKVRMGGDVPVEVEIRTLQIVHSDKFSLGDFNESTAYVRQPFKLSESDWLGIASELGYFDYAVFEILKPKIVEIPSLTSAISKLREAQQLFNEGKNEEVVTKCRQAFESINSLISYKKNDDYAMNQELATKIDLYCEGKPPRSKSIEQLRKKIMILLHTGPHVGYNVTREDAEYLLFLSLSTIRYYSTQLAKLSETP